MLWGWCSVVFFKLTVYFKITMHFCIQTQPARLPGCTSAKQNKGRRKAQAQDLQPSPLPPCSHTPSGEFTLGKLRLPVLISKHGAGGSTRWVAEGVQLHVLCPTDSPDSIPQGSQMNVPTCHPCYTAQSFHFCCNNSSLTGRNNVLV